MKRFKFALLALLLVPCLFLASCTKGISMSDYSARVANAAENFYSSYGSKSMTIESKSNSTQTWQENVSFGEADEHALQENFKTISEVSQKFELSVGNSDDTIIRNLRITETLKETTTGKEENDAQDGLKNFTHIQNEQRVITICLVGENYKAYITTTSSVDGGEEIIKNEYYDFASKSACLNWLEDLAEDGNSKLIEGVFFSPLTLVVGLVGGKVETYASGKNVFGQKGEVANTQVQDAIITSTTMSFDIQFKDSLPSRIEVNTNVINKDSHVSDDDIVNVCVKAKQVVSINYSCLAIQAPTSFEGATMLANMPKVEINTISLGI